MFLTITEKVFNPDTANKLQIDFEYVRAVDFISEEKALKFHNFVLRKNEETIKSTYIKNILVRLLEPERKFYKYIYCIR